MPKLPIRMTRIVATLGPASSAEDVIARMIDAGMDVARLNFAHGSHESHGRLIEMVRRVAKAKGRWVGVLQDLAGPKIRLRTPEGQPVRVEVGQRVQLVRRLASPPAPDAVATTYPAIVDDGRVGEPVLFGDGAVRMRITEKAADWLGLESEDADTLTSGMGVNLPETAVSAPSVTEKDWADLAFGLAQGVDYVGLSFVRSAEDVREVRACVREAGAPAQVVAKIEKPQAVEAIDAILEEADGLMVARGDLGVEMDVARVPVIQKDLIRRAAFAGVPVITATQMLQSMVTEPRPTRAEVSDVANAVFDGSDAVMLSGETAIGVDPVRVVRTMDHVIDLAEDYADQASWPAPGPVGARFVWAERAIVLGAARIARDLGATVVAALTHSGATALLLAKQWLRIPILAISDRLDTCRRMALYRGVVPAHHPDLIQQADLAGTVERLARERNWVADGDRVLIVCGQFPGRPGGTDTLRVHTVGRGAGGGT